VLVLTAVAVAVAGAATLAPTPAAWGAGLDPAAPAAPAAVSPRAAIPATDAPDPAARIAADAAADPAPVTDATPAGIGGADTVTSHPAPSGDTPDPRADVVQYGADYGTNTVVVAVQTASYAASGFDALWDIDVNGDGVVDYDVFFPSGNVRRDSDFYLLCGGTPLVSPSANTYLVRFPSQCLGDPASFRTRVFTQFGDSVDFAPHDNVSWSQWVTRGDLPFGSLDTPRPPPALRVTGWAIDPDVNGPTWPFCVDGAGSWIREGVPADMSSLRLRAEPRVRSLVTHRGTTRY
jgi:hypothetical protein